MTGIWFEDVVNIGPDGQTQDGLLAIYKDREDAEACMDCLRNEFKDVLEFRLVEDPVLMEPTLEQVIESLRWGGV